MYGAANNVQLVLEQDDNPIYNTFPMLERIVGISAGDCHSLILTESGNVWSAGNGSFGRTGRFFFNLFLLLLYNYLNTYIRTGSGLDGHDSLVFMKIDPRHFDNVKVDAIAAGDTHSLCLCSGSVYGFGDNCSVKEK